MEFAKTYSEIDRGGARSLVRNAALSALSTGMKLMGGMDKSLKKPRVQVLLLHHVFADEEAKFRDLLTALARRHTFISYSDAVRKIEAGTTEAIDKPYVTFSFDDGIRNCVKAAEILEEFGATACFFVCPGIVEEHDEAKIDAFCRQRLELPKAVGFMSWNELEHLLTHGHEIGGHTVNHVRLSSVSATEAVAEIRESFEVITRRLGSASHFAWTYGRFE
ncbi:MAG TPA: polysaccharide deacetylase family protein, partial [Phycisphaerales bacterium]|nr:polysaccharide deacetylase family protein [Phycisphaerales bacterium]